MKKFVIALCGLGLFFSSATAVEYLDPNSEAAAIIAAAQQSSGDEDLALNDYGPEAEEDFESKRDAWSSGFDWGVEYSRDETVDGNAYNDGYNAGYKEGYSWGSSDDDSSSYDEGYSDGYRDGFSSDRSSPDNDIIDRSEVHGSGIRESETSPAPFSDKTAESGWSKYYPYIIGVLACICLVLLIVIYRLSSTKKDTCKSLEKFEGITEELGDAVKKQPITEDKLREIIRKHII